MNVKRVLSLALMALLLCLPVWAMAAEVASGTNGENVNWSLDDAGTLTISGTGDMAGRYIYGYWTYFIDGADIKTVIIEDGIKSIGKEQFRFHENLQRVEIGKDVVSIGESAFDGCTALESVVFHGDKVNSMGEGAFYECSSLQSIHLPKGLTAIENNTFAWSGLTSIVIPENIETIDYNAFQQCRSLETVTIPKSVTSISTEEYNHAFGGCKSLKTVNVPCKWDKKPLYPFKESVTLNIAPHTNLVITDNGNGTHTINCDECGKTVKSHEWGAWSEITPAEPGVAGEERRECTECTAFENREIPALPIPVLPETGDEFNLILWSALACISLFGMTMLVRRRNEA